MTKPRMVLPNATIIGSCNIIEIPAVMALKTIVIASSI
eukprot:CAMPEP_0172400750 /NCGR_PEP_ID=MMETSP1061-20121228/47452_1 /TAXON_ID=37318 /ORGANISM="Pseudo-nitzschia pungens, Strain cf. pungens" /LENGTH=37 /DNA_ID= /DNA_START= /DNA_END= /DNA_ORIENTATION=